MSLVWPGRLLGLIIISLLMSAAANAQQDAPAIGAPLTSSSDSEQTDETPALQVAPEIQQAMLAYTQGALVMQKGDYDQAIKLFSFAVSRKPNDPQFHYMTAKAFQGAGEFRGQWFHLRKAVRLQPNHKQALPEFMHMWQVALNKGVLDIGNTAANVRAALGEPDEKTEINPEQQRSLWQYGVMGVELRSDQVAGVMDLRGSGDLPTPQDDLEIVLDSRQEWKVKQQFASRSEFKVVYTSVETTEPKAQFTHQRLLGMAEKTSVQDLMQNMKAGLEQQFPEVQWQVMQAEDNNVVFEWWLQGEDLPQQHEIVRLLQGDEDIHRLAYSVQTAPLAQEQREQWIKRLQQAKLVELTQ